LSNYDTTITGKSYQAPLLQSGQQHLNLLERLLILLNLRIRLSKLVLKLLFTLLILLLAVLVL
jgi:hypothetical protein